jgi:hypothetical protein
MTDTPRVEQDTRGNGGKQRWYDPFRVTMTLFAIVSLFVLTWCGFTFTKATNAADKNIEQDERLKALDKAVDRIETKLDKVLDRLPK